MKRIEYIFSADEEKEMLDAGNSCEAAYTSYVMSSSDKFKVGDCLIMKESKLDKDRGIFLDRDCQYENIPLTIRYIVVKELSNSDNQNAKLLYIKRLDENGQLDTNLNARLLFSYEHDLNWNKFYKFEIDPFQIDHTLLGEDYNVEQIFNTSLQHKKHIVNIRKSKAKVFTDLDELHFFLKKIHEGSGLLYFHENVDQEYEIESVRAFSIKHHFVFQNYKRFINTSYGARVLARASARGINIEPKPNLQIAKMPSSRDIKWVTSLDLLNCAIYTEQPPSFKD